jgi:hypothetical protein
MLLDFVYNSLRNLLLNFTFNFLLAISQDRIHLSLSFSDFEIFSFGPIFLITFSPFLCIPDYIFFLSSCAFFTIASFECGSVTGRDEYGASFVP